MPTEAYAADQVIVAYVVPNNPADFAALLPLTDAGLASAANHAAVAERGIRTYPVPGRGRRGDGHEAGAKRLRRCPRMAAMDATIRRTRRRSRYRLCEQVVEPVLLRIKQVKGLRQFLLRDVVRTRDDWAMLCTAQTVRKLLKAAARG